MAIVRNNTTGIPMNVSKTPQCRHSEKQGFVSYVVTSGARSATAQASCSNCGSEGELVTHAQPVDAEKLIEEARNALMRVEAPPLVIP